MRRAYFLLAISLFVFSTYCAATEMDMENYCAVPPFMTINIPKTNVLVILDNSNSMDEDFYGNAVGSYSPISKSVAGRKALRENILEPLKDKFRMGLMTYKLFEKAKKVKKYYLYNSPYFASYEPKSYCPPYKVCSNDPSKPCESDDDCGEGNYCRPYKVCSNDPSKFCESDDDCSDEGHCVDPCVEYCQTGDATFRDICKSKCQAGNPDFDVDYFDEIITTYPICSDKEREENNCVRDRYCRLVYPKTQSMPNPTDRSHSIYYKHAYAVYDVNATSVLFAYSRRHGETFPKKCRKRGGKAYPPYDPHEAETDKEADWYCIFKTKKGTSDWYNDYTNCVGGARLIPTDTDLALGYKDFGRRVAWEYVGRTWFSNGSPGKGYLHVPVGDLVDEDGNLTSTYTKLEEKLDPKENDEKGYMSCRRGNRNKCPYIINAGLTPTAGTLQTAIDYLKGEHSPVEYWCQRTFIVYVTDGLPSVDEKGNSGTADELMPAVLEKLDILKNYRCSNDPSKLCTTDADCEGGSCVPSKVCSNNLSQSCTTDEDCPSGGYCVYSPYNIKTYILGVGFSDEAKSKLDEMAVHGGTDVNGHAYYADDPDQLEKALSKIFLDILTRVSSGTSASMLPTSTEASGSICQAYFSPEYINRENTDERLCWIGHLKGFWMDSLGQIREDTEEDKKLVLDKDRVMKYFLEGDRTWIHLYDSDEKGNVEFPCSPDETSRLDKVKTIWDVGKKLWQTDTKDRKIYTSINGSSFIDFKTDNASILKAYLRAYARDENDNTDAEKIINYIRGIDNDICLDSDAGKCDETGHRSRELTINGETRIWKLGDIIYSTPMILSHFPLNKYDILYQDKTYFSYDKDHPGYINKKVYDPHPETRPPTIKRDDYLFVGANDGMLHCFYLGQTKNKFCYNPNLNSYTNNTCETDKDCDKGYVCKKKPGIEVQLEGTDIGKELWAYIPMNALPYLKYLAYPDYCHIYYVDQRPLLFDASINTPNSVQVGRKKWATILIGEMRFGGSPEPAVCFDSEGKEIDCSNSDDVAKKVGLSSIFALDVTDPEDPVLLWEFTDEGLGFTTSYPAIVRIGNPKGPHQDDGVNGKWYVVLGSGPLSYDGDTPPSTGHIYVIDLKTGDLVRKIEIGSNTYVGDCIALDPDHDYTVDAVYCGTVIKQTDGTFTGKILRLLTEEKDDPTNWEISELLDAEAPVTAMPVFAFDDLDRLWCFFGTGKYFGEADKTDSSQQYLYGIKEPCWDEIEKTYNKDSCHEVNNEEIFDATEVKVKAKPSDYICMCEGGKVDCCEYNTDGTCRTPAKDGNNGCNCGEKVVTEVDVNSVEVENCEGYKDWDSCAEHIANDYEGWKIRLHTGSPAERCISKAGVAAQLAMFPTFTPNDDICGCGGDSNLFSVYYKAGIAYKQPAILLKAGFKNGEIQRSVSIGKGVPGIGESIVTKQVGGKLETKIQLSTGQVKEVPQRGIFLPNKVQFWIEE